MMGNLLGNVENWNHRFSDFHFDKRIDTTHLEMQYPELDNLKNENEDPLIVVMVNSMYSKFKKEETPLFMIE